MQKISSCCCTDIIKTNGALIASVRGLARRWSFYISSGLTVMAMKLAMPSLTSILSRLRGERSEGGGARQTNRYANIMLFDLLNQMHKPLCLFPSASLESKHEIEIMYFGRASEFLLMTSERMVIPSGAYTLEQVLSSLRQRDDRWAYELDDSHVVCTVNGKTARPFDTIAAGVEINIFSKKSIFEL